jgi:anaerobic dimethyl sulfoxide reductase subunit B (iron-sulfur subunit)
MTQNAFYYDGTRCTGCKTCVFACKDKNNLGLGTAYRKVYEYTGGETRKDQNGICTTSCWSYYLSIPCNHCDAPACVKVCPTGAMHKDASTGLVTVDSQRCIGCGYCHMACPYNVPKVDREKGHSVKCDGCTDLVSGGEKPACVMACPARAIQFGTVEQMSKMGERAAVAPLPDPSYTVPNLFIKPSPDYKPIGDTTGCIANPLEVQ